MNSFHFGRNPIFQQQLSTTTASSHRSPEPLISINDAELDASVKRVSFFYFGDYFGEVWSSSCKKGSGLKRFKTTCYLKEHSKLGYTQLNCSHLLCVLPSSPGTKLINGNLLKERRLDPSALIYRCQHVHNLWFRAFCYSREGCMQHVVDIQ